MTPSHPIAPIALRPASELLGALLAVEVAVWLLLALRTGAWPPGALLPWLAGMTLLAWFTLHRHAVAAAWRGILVPAPRRRRLRRPATPARRARAIAAPRRRLPSAA